MGDTELLLVAVAWMYVVVMVALVEALSPGGSWLGAVVTLLFWGALPLGIVLYLMSAPARRRLRKAREQASAAAGDGRQHAAGDPVAPVREEP